MVGEVPLDEDLGKVLVCRYSEFLSLSLSNISKSFQGVHVCLCVCVEGWFLFVKCTRIGGLELRITFQSSSLSRPTFLVLSIISGKPRK